MLHFKWLLPILVCFNGVLFKTNSQHSLYLLRNQLKFKVQCQKNQYLETFAICPCFFKDRRCYIQARNGHNKFHPFEKKKKKGVNWNFNNQSETITARIEQTVSLKEDMLPTPLHHLFIFGSFWPCFLSRILSRGPLKWVGIPVRIFPLNSSLIELVLNSQAVHISPAAPHPTQTGAHSSRARGGLELSSAWEQLSWKENFHKSSA